MGTLMGPRVCPLGQFFWDGDNLFLTIKELHCIVLGQCLFLVGLGAGGIRSDRGD